MNPITTKVKKKIRSLLWLAAGKIGVVYIGSFEELYSKTSKKGQILNNEPPRNPIRAPTTTSLYFLKRYEKTLLNVTRPTMQPAKNIDTVSYTHLTLPTTLTV